MKNFLLISAFLLLALAPAPSSVPVYGRDVFNTGVFRCGTEGHLTWTNTLGDIRIYQSQVWIGMYAGDVTDIWAQVNIGDNILHRGNWDHYVDPSGIGDQMMFMNWTPNYIVLKNGETIHFYYGCNQGTAQLVYTLWYAK